jgi:hypothetical protein
MHTVCLWCGSGYLTTWWSLIHIRPIYSSYLLPALADGSYVLQMYPPFIPCSQDGHIRVPCLGKCISSRIARIANVRMTRSIHIQADSCW